MSKHIHYNFWQGLWKQFKKRKLGYISFYIVILYVLVGIYAPFLASSKPLMVQYNGSWYFPLFRYLFYPGFYSKNLDIFFNLLMFTFPVGLFAFFVKSKKTKIFLIIGVFLTQFLLFFYFIFGSNFDPASDKNLNLGRENALKHGPLPSWNFDLGYMSPYAQLNLLLKERRNLAEHQRLIKYSHPYYLYAHSKGLSSLPTLWQSEQDHNREIIESQKRTIKEEPQDSLNYKYAEARIKYIGDKQEWIHNQSKQLHYVIMPLLSDFHWEEDAGGEMALNQFLPWWELTRTNRKNLLAALIFGVRISLVVGTISVLLALIIGIPFGSFAGYYGGTLDIIVSRLLEIWEAMPTFFMLLMVVSITQSKSIFIIITVIGIFGWTGFSRFIRGEFFKQRNLPYVEACHALGFKESYIMFSHILPNAVPPLLTLLPFAIMGAITSEAGLSFLGLGEEGSCSWGVLMDEGRNAFPSESYLLWPPAILLTILLVAIALVGDAFRDALDPKMHK